MTALLRLRGPGRTALSGVTGVLLVVGGAVLVVRPLTSLLSLAIVIGAVLLVGSALLVAGAGRVPASLRLLCGVAPAIAGVAVLIFRSNVIQALPYLLAIVLAGRALWTLVAVVRRRIAPGRRCRSIVYALSCALFSVLAGQWPDAAAIAIGAAFAGALMILGSVMIIAGMRPGPRAAPGGRTPRRDHPVLRAVGAGVLLAVACILTYGSSTLKSADVHPDDFYAWSGAIPSQPGTVLRTSPYSGRIPHGALAVRVLYSTSYSDGSPALASVVVTYPKASAGAQPRPVLAWQHGTTGVTRTCAPSLGENALAESAVPGISRAIHEEWVVVATDYPGQGTAGRYPYLIGQGEGRATLDGIRAARALSDAHASDAAWLWGHSQGGHATLWAAQIAEDYAPEIRILGVAALSAASDPLALARHITTDSSGALSKVVTSLVLVPYSDEYPDVDLGDTVHPAGIGIVRAFAGRCTIDAQTLVSVLVATALQVDAPLYHFDLSTGSTRERLQQNSATGIVPAPLFFGQGKDDEVIPIGMQRALTAQLCAAGRVVQSHEYARMTHMGVVAEGSPLIDDLFAWADAVLQRTASNSCDADSG